MFNILSLTQRRLTYSVRKVSDDKENKPPSIPAARRQEKQDGGEREAGRGGGELHKRKRSPQRNRQSVFYTSANPNLTI